MAFQREGSEGHHEVNLTPLIDVSLVLVVILLLASPLALESSILVRDTSSGKKASKNTKMDYVELNIVSRDVVEVNRKAVEVDNLEETLRPLLAQSSSGRVVVTCAGQVPHGVFVDVLDQAKQSGASTIGVTGN